MHSFAKTFFIVLCVIFSASVKAEDFVSVVEHPYEEVEQSYGAVNIENGRCQQGTPFSVSQRRFQSTKEMDLASQVHDRLRSMGANGFVILELKEDTLVKSIKVVPLTCALS